MATAYQRGRRLEYRVMERLRQSGYFCVRAAGSHSPVDIVAAKDGVVYFLQVQRSRYIPKQKLTEFKQAVQTAGVKGYFVVTDSRGRLVWLDADGSLATSPL